MKIQNGIEKLETPVYIKTDDFQWPEDKLFYLLTADGMFLCRNHPWFKSSALAKHGPSELQKHEPTCSISYPKIPRLLLERAVGFFHEVYKKDHTECALILVFNRQTNQVELVCPEQECSYGSVHYQIPNMAPHMALIGDLHSHCNFTATPSMTDENDEMKRPGLHIIIGDITQEPPGFYACVVVDGERFKIEDHSMVFEDYIQRDTASVPEEWATKVKDKKYEYTSNGNGYCGGYGGNWMPPQPSKEDKEIIRRILSGWVRGHHKPRESELKQELFRSTKHASYLYCENKAKKFVAAWNEMKKGQHEEATYID